MQMDEVDYNECFNNKEYDKIIIDKKTGHTYHAGVTLAIHEILGKVSVKNTFWAMRKREGEWEPVNL